MPESNTDPQAMSDPVDTEADLPEPAASPAAEGEEPLFTAAELERRVLERLTETERELDEARAQLREREREALRAKVAAKYGMPPELAERLRGETEAELESDARALAQCLPAVGSASSPGNPAGGRAAALTLEGVRLMTSSEINAGWDDVRRVLANGR